MLKWLKKLFTKEGKNRNLPNSNDCSLTEIDYAKYYEGKCRTIGIREPHLGLPSVAKEYGSWEDISNNNNKNETI